MAESELASPQDAARNVTNGEGILMLAHDLGSPLTAIRVLAELLHEDAVSEESREDARDVLEAADMAAALVEGLSALTRAHLGIELARLPLDLAKVLATVVDRPVLERRVGLQVPNSIELKGDRRALERALTDVFLNAARLVDPSKSVVCTAEVSVERITLLVQHPGVTFGAADLQQLIQPGGAVALRGRRVPVVAMGLYYAACVFEKHGSVPTFEESTDGVVLRIDLRR